MHGIDMSFEDTISQRQWLRYSGRGLVGATASGWLPALAAGLEGEKPRRHCILLWMNGGPSQLDTFDMKPDHPNGGPFKPIATRAAGVQFSEHLPGLAEQAAHVAVIRSVSTKEGDHGRGTFLMRTGYRPGGPVEYPTLGSLMAKELGDDAAELPEYVSISPYEVFNPAAYGPGFLGRDTPRPRSAVARNRRRPQLRPTTCNWDSTTCTFRRASMRNKRTEGCNTGTLSNRAFWLRAPVVPLRRITWSIDARSA